MLIVAHDGFPRWTDAGADFVEVDVRQGAQGTFILAHDEPAPGVANPSLEDALQAGCPLHLDLKASGFEVALVRHVLERLRVDQVVVTTGLDESIRTVKEALPGVRAGLTLGERLTEWTWSRIDRCGADFVAVDHRYAEWYARQPLRVWLWTVDDQRLLERYIGEGWPEAVITNRPDVALRIRKGRP